MKDFALTILVAVFELIPRKLRLLACSLNYHAAARRGDTDGLVELLTDYDQLRRHIDTCAIRREGGLHPKHRITRYHEFFTGRVRSGERVLDVGCGVGAVAHDMALAGAIVIGVDLSYENIKVARSMYSHDHLSFVVGDATKELPVGNYQTVVLSNVLEHIDDRVGFLRKVHDAVQPSRWLIRVPMINRDWLVLLKKELGLPFFSDPTHFTEYTREGFEVEMKSAGLRIKTLECIWGEIWSEVENV